MEKKRTNLSGIFGVVHEKEINVSNVVDNEGVELVRAKVTSNFVVTVSNLDVGASASESAALATIDTLGGSPGGSLGSEEEKTRAWQSEEDAKRTRTQRMNQATWTRTEMRMWRSPCWRMKGAKRFLVIFLVTVGLGMVLLG